MPVHADTDGLLDRCAQCRAPAGFIACAWSPELQKARCTECCAQTDYHADRYAAVIEWNIAQRALQSSMQAYGVPMGSQPQPPPASRLLTVC